MALREMREQLGLTQVELAERAGIDQTTVSKLELGTMQNPSWPVVAKLARALGVNPEDLFPIEVAK